MIKITIEMCPGGDETRAYHLGTAKIWNDATGSLTKANYKFWFSNRAGRIWKKGRIEGFPRKRLLMWDLFFRCLSSIIGSRNNSVELIEQDPNCKWTVCPVHDPEEYAKEKK